MIVDYENKIKRCSGCGEWKPFDDYYKKSTGKPTPKCKTCYRAKVNEKRQSKRDELTRIYKEHPALIMSPAVWDRMIDPVEVMGETGIHADGTIAKQVSDPLHLPWQTLASNIILYSYYDYKRASSLTIRECSEFFRSVWFEELCDYVGVSPKIIRDELGIRGDV